MLTSLYSIIATMRTLLFGHRHSFLEWHRQRSMLAGILGILAKERKIRISIPDVARLFGVSRKTVYQNINRITEIEARIQELLDSLAGCIIVTPKDVDKLILSLALDAHAPLEGIQRVLNRIYDGMASRSIGYISTLLTRAGAFSEEILKTISLKGITQGANDEISMR